MAVDEETAVAALVGAKDAEGLEAAIAQAGFLDSKPGESRQKLRAARTRLKKLKMEEEAKYAAAVANKDISPYRKEKYDVAEFEVLAGKYEKLNWRIISKPGGATVKPDDFYKLYGFYQQATKGDNTTERPMWAEKGGLDFEGRAKWDAWTNNKGMAAEKAKLSFVKTYYDFGPKSLYKDARTGDDGKEVAAEANPAPAEANPAPAEADKPAEGSTINADEPAEADTADADKP